MRLGGTGPDIGRLEGRTRASCRLQVTPGSGSALVSQAQGSPVTLNRALSWVSVLSNWPTDTSRSYNLWWTNLVCNPNSHEGSCVWCPVVGMLQGRLSEHRRVERVEIQWVLGPHRGEGRPLAAWEEVCPTQERA